MGSRIYKDEELGDILLCKSARARRLSVSVSAGRKVRVTMPYHTSYNSALAFFLQSRAWVIETIGRQRQRQAGATIGEGDMTLRDMAALAAEKLPGRIALLAQRYGFGYAGLHLQHNRSNWGSCSARKNINLNINLVRLPQALCDHVIIHELCHLRHMNHGADFHDLLEKLTADNIMNHSDPEDPCVKELKTAVSHSRSRWPLTRAAKAMQKKYPII